MTLRQKACEKIALLPDDNVRIVLALLDEMIRQNNEYNVDSKKKQAYQNILKLREQSTFPKNFNYQEILEESLAKKYADFY